jgi:hypothetical protein
MAGQMNGQTDILTNRQMDEQTKRQLDEQIDVKWMDGWIDRHRCIHI